jgi:hypothetical protein
MKNLFFLFIVIFFFSCNKNTEELTTIDIITEVQNWKMESFESQPFGQTTWTPISLDNCELDNTFTFVSLHKEENFGSFTIKQNGTFCGSNSEFLGNLFQIDNDKNIISFNLDYFFPYYWGNFKIEEISKNKLVFIQVNENTAISYKRILVPEK